MRDNLNKFSRCMPSVRNTNDSAAQRRHKFLPYAFAQNGSFVMKYNVVVTTHHKTGTVWMDGVFRVGMAPLIAALAQAL